MPSIRPARINILTGQTVMCLMSVAHQPARAMSPWPDPAFLPDRQCRGKYAMEDLQRYLPQAKLAMWLPSTRSVALDEERRCITVRVESVSGGRLAELVMRGVAVARGAVLLQLTPTERRRT